MKRFSILLFSVQILLGSFSGKDVAAMNSEKPATAAGAKIKHASGIHNENKAHKYFLADGGLKNPNFSEFRQKLIEACDRKDTEYILSVMSPKIEMAIGGGIGKAEFVKEWDGLSVESKFFARLKRVLVHGAQYDSESDEFHAPAVAFEDSHADLPQGIVWTPKAPIRARPLNTLPQIALIYDEQLTIADPPETQPLDTTWIKVKRRSGLTGYMKMDDVYSSYDEFAVFKKEHGKWVLSWFGYAGL